MCASSPGANFDAQPAHLTVLVRRTFLPFFLEVMMFVFKMFDWLLRNL